MALVNCSECNNKISDEAKQCPKCGVTVNLEKIKAKSKQASNGCLIAIGIIMTIFVIANTCSSSDSNESNSSIQTISGEIISDTIALKKMQDSINKAVEIEVANFKKTKAGKIQRKHPKWSRDDCEKIANNRIWIGMRYEMLLYQRGKPNTVNASNYGNGEEYQCCWDDYTTSCFYMKEDNIIYSYN